VSSYFQNTSQGFTFTQATNAVGAGAVPMVTLEFWDPAGGVSQPSFSLAKIAGGSFDTYLHAYAKSAKAFGSPVWLRPLHEMNGNWYPWGGTVNGNTPASFIAAWRHIHDIFVSEGATNVSFVWCPNADSVPATTANSISAYWPGDGYVDLLGLDGYNFGGSAWRSFSSTFSSAYAKVTALSSKPVVVGEIGCATQGGNKAAWITDMFKVIPASFPRIAGIAWFDADKECDWRVESDAASLAAFSAGATAWHGRTHAAAPVATRPGRQVTPRPLRRSGSRSR
jgi:beta-mannanase